MGKRPEKELYRKKVLLERPQRIISYLFSDTYTVGFSVDKILKTPRTRGRLSP
jgi:hypothetical protein